jgi:hypothetical protein
MNGSRPNVSRRSGLAPVAFAFAVLGGCASPPPLISGEAEVRSALPYVVPGETTRESLLLRFGPPAWSFEDGRIVTWRLQRDDAGNFAPKVATTTFVAIRPAYGLVVIFDARGCVERFNLVDIG